MSGKLLASDFKKLTGRTSGFVFLCSSCLPSRVTLDEAGVATFKVKKNISEKEIGDAKLLSERKFAKIINQMNELKLLEEQAKMKIMQIDIELAITKLTKHLEEMSSQISAVNEINTEGDRATECVGIISNDCEKSQDDSINYEAFQNAMIDSKLNEIEENIRNQESVINRICKRDKSPSSKKSIQWFDGTTRDI